MRYSVLECFLILMTFFGSVLSIQSCFKAPSNELESMTEVVLKKHEGIDIKVVPIDIPKAP